MQHDDLTRAFFLFLISLPIISISSLRKESRNVARITKTAASEMSAEVAKYTYTKQYFALAAPSQVAAMNSYDSAEEWIFSLWVSEDTSTLAVFESAALASEYAALTSEGAIWATCTGTRDPSPSPNSVPTSSAYVVPGATADAPSSAG